MESTPTPPSESREARFVSGVIQRCQNDKGLAARLRRAENPATEYQSWELLAAFGIDLEKEWERLPFVTIAATLAKHKAEHNGTRTLGQALAQSYQDKQNNEQAKARLRRLLACHELSEVVRHLRPLLSLIHSKSGQPLDYQRLLQQLRRFSLNPQAIKAQWAQEFYAARQSVSEGEPS